jgi:hypothetical protein
MTAADYAKFGLIATGDHAPFGVATIQQSCAWGELSRGSTLRDGIAAHPSSLAELAAAYRVRHDKAVSTR